MQTTDTTSARVISVESVASPRDGSAAAIQPDLVLGYCVAG
jgi:hypothetical protein